MKSSHITEKSFYIFTYVITTGVVFVFAFMLLRFPENAGNGISKGIELCLYTLFPSMYPFMFLSSFVISSGLCEKSKWIFSYITEKIFRLPGVCGSMIVLSMVGGLPIGGKMTAEMYDKGYITKRQGQRLIMFCMNPGPAFVITTVGHYLTGSAQIGVLVFTALVISSLSVGFLTRFIYSDDDFEYKISKNTACTKISIKDAIVSSVTESGRGMLNVCAWVILFSCISEMIALLPLNEGTKTFINCILEVTNGCEYAAQSQPVPVLAGIIGFSGICAHLQIMPAITKVKLPIKYFLSARIINGSLAVVITMLLLKLFPITVQTISMGSLPERINTDISAPVCVGIMIMSVLLLLGENYRIRNKTKKTA